MERKIVEVKEANKSETKVKKKVDLQKVAKVISENKETIAVVASTLGTLINSSSGKTTSKTKKRSTTSSTKSKSKSKKKAKSNDTVSTLVDILLK